MSAAPRSRVRIVGGQWRSRLLAVPAVAGLRPTPDRVRETLFNWLGQDLDGWSVLDLFAGSGVIGLEAASRGAARVVLVEQDPAAFANLRQSVAELGARQVEVIRADALRFASSQTGLFDLVILDPPYRQGMLERLEPHIARLVRPGGQVYAESEKPLAGLAGLTAVKQGRAGQVYYHLLREMTE